VIQDDFLRAQVRLFASIADPLRLQVLRLLQQKGPMHVTNIYESLSKPQNLVSHHLNCLKTCGLVRVEKVGRRMIYEIADAEIAHILAWAEKQVLAEAERILSCKMASADA